MAISRRPSTKSTRTRGRPAAAKAKPASKPAPRARSKAKAKPAKTRAHAKIHEVDDKEYVVEDILQAKPAVNKTKRRFWKYLVKWQGYGVKDNSWEPAQCFTDKSTLEEFWSRFEGGKPDLKTVKIGTAISPGKSPAIASAEEEEEEEEEEDGEGEEDQDEESPTNGNSKRKHGGRPSGASQATPSKKKKIDA